jgi:hypothetical protein
MHRFSAALRGYVRLGAVTRPNACFAVIGRADMNLLRRVVRRVRPPAPAQTDVGLSSVAATQRKKPRSVGALWSGEAQARTGDTMILRQPGGAAECRAAVGMLGAFSVVRSAATSSSTSPSARVALDPTPAQECPSDWRQGHVPRRHRAAATSRGYPEDLNFGLGTRIPRAVAPLAPATANGCVEPS